MFIYLTFLKGCEREIQYKEIFDGCYWYVYVCISANYDRGASPGGWPAMALGDRCCSSPGHLWFEVEQIATEGIFAFLNLVL